MCDYNRCSQSHIPAGRAVSCFLTSVPMNGELRLSGQAVDLAGRRKLRGPARSGSHEPGSCRGLPARPQDHSVRMEKQT